MIKLTTKQSVARLLQSLGKTIIERRLIRDNETEITIDKRDLPGVCDCLFHDKQGRLFTMVGSDEREINGCFVLYYVFCFDSLRHFITVKVLLG
ncbi:MAG: hypothetical protein ACRDBM_02980, partial [Sporomusa sp.]